MKSLIEYINEAQSKPTVEWMEEHYKKFNKELFNNELPQKIRLGLIIKKGETSLGWQGFDKDYYCLKQRMKNDMYVMLYFDDGYIRNGRVATYNILNECKEAKSCEELNPYIELNPRYQFSDYQKEDTLIHEMIHLWVSKDGLNPKRAHGKEFKRKCDEIRKLAHNLYGIEYQLTTYAKHENDENKDFKVADSVMGEITNEIKKAAKRGGGVYSIYATYRLGGITNPRLITMRNRFMFCTKAKLEHILEQVKKSDGVEHIWVSPTSYVKMCATYGKFATVNNYCRFWNCGKDDPYDDKYLLEDAEDILSIHEGLGSKIKSWLKKLMNTFIKVTKNTPSSEIDMEDILELANKETSKDNNQDVKSSPKNEKNVIELD